MKVKNIQIQAGVKKSNVPEIQIPSGNTSSLSKNWENSKIRDEMLSPNNEMKVITNQMKTANPSIVVNDVIGQISSSNVDCNVVTTSMSKDESGYKDKVISGRLYEEFDLKVGFSFLNEVKLNQVENDSKLKYTEIDTDNGGDGSNDSIVCSDENGNLINMKEGVTKSKNEMGERTANSVQSKDTNRMGTIINSINMEPSLLGPAGKGNRVNAIDNNGKVKFDFSYAGALRGPMHKRKLEVKYISIGDGKEDGPAIILIENLKKASLPYSNTFYGYLIDKKIAFPDIQKELKRW